MLCASLTIRLGAGRQWRCGELKRGAWLQSKSLLMALDLDGGRKFAKQKYEISSSSNRNTQFGTFVERNTVLLTTASVSSFPSLQSIYITKGFARMCAIMTSSTNKERYGLATDALCPADQSVWSSSLKMCSALNVFIVAAQGTCSGGKCGNSAQTNRFLQLDRWVIIQEKKSVIDITQFNWLSFLPSN